MTLGTDRMWKAAVARRRDGKDNFEIEQRGHSAWFEKFSDLELEFDLGDDAKREIIGEAWETGNPATNPVRWRVSTWSHQACQYCGAREWETDGYTIRAMTECPYPDGYDVVSVDIPIPSGRLYFGNDFRSAFPSEAGEEAYVNVASEIKVCTEAYAEEGMAHFYVGNTCPSVYREMASAFIIGNAAYDYETGEVVEPLPGKEVAHICTDLWWVSIVDGDEADNRGLDASDIEEVAVPPGVYRLDYYALKKGFEMHGDMEGSPVTYARFYRVDDVGAQGER